MTDTQLLFQSIPSLPFSKRTISRAYQIPKACDSTDRKYMHRCVELARKAVGHTRPNPPVGCVLTTSSGEIIGEGYHKKAGTAHAEVNALRDAAKRGNTTIGATAYVSLEPCDSYGRTPPCSRALLAAGVSRVVVGVIDADPRTSGGGATRLRDAGIQVDVGVEKDICEQLVEGFFSRIRHQRPFGTLKYAMTLDGKIAAQGGHSKWITGPDARQIVHNIRKETDAIIVGGETVRKDDPRLTVRTGISDNDDHGQVVMGDNNILRPIRVVMTRSMELPLEARIWKDCDEQKTVVLADAAHGKPIVVSELRARGVAVEEVPGLKPDSVMEYLYEQDCLNALWECGGSLAANAIRDGAVQKVHAFVAPKLVGGAHAPSPIGSPPLCEDMTKAIVLSKRKIQTFDNGDFLISGYIDR